MFCTKCGQQILDGSQFCPYCGAAQETARSDGGMARQATPLNAVQQPPFPNGGATGYYQQNAVPQNAPGYGKYGPFEGKMKWYKFLSYFALWASALLNAYNGIQFMTGSLYGDSQTASLVYGMFPRLKTLDTFCGIASLAVAALAVITALKLLGLKKDAPKFLIGVYCATLLVGLIYAFLASKTLGVSLKDVLDTSSTSSIATSAAMIGINMDYFRKRASLFVN